LEYVENLWQTTKTTSSKILASRWKKAIALFKIEQHSP